MYHFIRNWLDAACQNRARYVSEVSKIMTVTLCLHRMRTTLDAVRHNKALCYLSRPGACTCKSRGSWMCPLWQVHSKKPLITFVFLFEGGGTIKLAEEFREVVNISRSPQASSSDMLDLEVVSGFFWSCRKHVSSVFWFWGTGCGWRTTWWCFDWAWFMGNYLM